MDIIADFSNNYIRSICYELRKFHNIIVFDGHNSVYNILDRTKPNLCFCQNLESELLKVVASRGIPTILFGAGKQEDFCRCIGVCVDSAEKSKYPIVLPNFGSKNEYSGYYQYDLESDILFSSNYNYNLLVRLYNYLFMHSDYKIKFAGKNIVNCCSFVGATSNEEFGSLAKSTKVVITDNIFEHISLILSNICSLLMTEIKDNLDKCVDEKYREQVIETKKKEYRDCTAENVSKIINNKIEEYAKTSSNNK